MKLLFLDLDALSPHHMSCYGYNRQTTPNIDEIAKQGVRFSNYYTSDAPCAPSRTALMSGQLGIRNGLVGHGGTAGDMKLEGVDRQLFGRLSLGDSLPSFLQLTQGLHTTLISPFAQRHSTFNFYAGFNEIINTGKHGMESAEEVTPTVKDWVERNADKDDWFLYINYWDAHTPYRAPAQYGNPFKDDALPEWATEERLEKHKEAVGSHTVHELEIDFHNQTYTNESGFERYPGEIQDMDDLRKMIDGYDVGIHYIDHHIGLLFDALEKQGVMDDVVIMISADHGENMGQLGIYGEHATADDGTCRIPMIVRWPGMQEGHVDNDLHYHLDLLPTLAELFDEAPSPNWDGQSYASVLQNGESNGRDYLVISQCAHVAQRSVRFGDWLYMRTYHDGYHLFNKEMLFNLKEDPREDHNVAEEHPELCRKGAHYLLEWHDEAMMESKDGIDPLWTVMQEGGPFHARGYLQNYLKRLEETGRGHHVPELKRRHPNEIQSDEPTKEETFRANMRGKLFKSTL
ncbi:sulfatase family protein [Gracilibacillus suaedae]|uniref:sulfatase family protein n=1 Tax=Gracilibacillus suaedae TaxID=2820273 RepID=UPI001ABE2C0C|nr:sulfatase [Gracilibacillus suaedae]